MQTVNKGFGMAMLMLDVKFNTKKVLPEKKKYFLITKVTI